MEGSPRTNGVLHGAFGDRGGYGCFVWLSKLCFSDSNDDTKHNTK